MPVSVRVVRRMILSEPKENDDENPQDETMDIETFYADGDGVFWGGH